MLLFLLLAMPASAQVDNVMVYGTVKDMSSARKLDGVVVTVFKNGAKLVEVTTNASGKYEVNLDYGADYKVMCAKSGFVAKNIAIDTRNVPEEERQGGHGMNIDFTLMAEIEGVDYSILLEPFGKASYMKTSGNFEWDMEYTTRMRDAQARLLKEYDEKKKREVNADVEFAKLLAQGDAAMKLSDFKKAVASFTSALEMKPADAIATAKLSDAKMRLDQQEGDKKREEQYAALVKEADALYTKKDYETAKSKYAAALDIKFDQPYPKERIKAIDIILADVAKKAEEERKARELQEKYQAAIAAADAAFKANSWEQAVTKYTEASGLKPEEKYPKDQLVLVAQKRAEAEKKAEEERLARELQEKYQAAITAADAAFKSNKWDEATTRYTEASGLKPEEKYPKDQLALVAQRRSEAEKKAQEELLAKQLNDKYQAAIAAADGAFKSAQYDAAKAKYNEALELKPAEKYPTDQLAAIEKKLDELARQADEERRTRELNEQYQALITAADAAFTGEQWDEAVAKYTEASELKPTERYPKDQISAVQKRKDELAKKADDERRTRELNERYDAAISAADEAFDAQDWEGATTKYNEASGLKPTEKYPKDQLAAITVRKADAEAQRKQQEIDARYNEIIENADAAFGKKDLAGSKAKYEEALKVKPSEQYPKDRIAEVEALLAEQARSAEEERARKERDARYAELVERADKAYDKKDWSAALNDYKDALQLKPDESHPQERITAIEDQLDASARAKAEEERLERERQEREQRYSDLIAAADKAFAAKSYADARDAYAEALGVKPEEQHPQDRLVEIEQLLAELARQEEEARLAAEKAAAEKARLEEEERLRQMSAAEVEARYQEAVAAADMAYDAGDMEKASERYRSALDIRPEATYPQERLAAIAAEKERQRLAMDEAARLAEEARLREEERLRREAEEAEARRLAEEKERSDRESAKAMEERYRSTIVSADEAFATKAYEQARGLYAEASDLRPEETYPLAKMEQIDQLLAEMERKRQEAELAAERARAKEAERPQKNTALNSNKEQEAEQFMRAAREREEAEKYERIKKLRSDLNDEERANADAASERRGQSVEQKQQYEANAVGLYQGDEGRRVQNAQDVEAYKEALAVAEAERVRRSMQVREGNYDGKIRLQEKNEDQRRTWDDRQAGSNMATAQRIADLREQGSGLARQGAERNQEARKDALEQAQRMNDLNARGSELTEAQWRIVEDEKRAREARETGYARTSEVVRSQAKEQLDRTPKDQPRAYGDYHRSQLAMDYPPGVTEESYTEGNKVIIRRVVVNGNKADEYSKVIAKWGTFYFKNGQSITEAIWSKETEG